MAAFLVRIFAAIAPIGAVHSQLMRITTQPAAPPIPTDAPQRVVRTLLVADLVESVRLMETNEDDLVERWERLALTVVNDVLPVQRGRFVKSLGDGLLLDFAGVPAALATAFAIQSLCAQANIGVSRDRTMNLRMSLHTAEVISGELDVYGRGVNLAIRLASLAGPGDLVASAEVRDRLTPALDAEFEDLGECYLKHVRLPVRAYRVRPPGPRPRIVIADAPEAPPLRPTIAVIPFTTHSRVSDDYLLGEIMAEEIIASLSRSPELDVISRLSTTALRDRAGALNDAFHYLNATYVLSGSYRTLAGQLNVVAELAEARSGRVVWSETYKAQVGAFLQDDEVLIAQIVQAVAAAVSAHEIRRALVQPLPTLECSTLQMGAIALMHRGGAQDFDRARAMLEAVIERARLVATPYAWLAKWHVLGFNRGWSSDQKRAAQLALDCTKRALDLDANCGLALVVDGFIHTNLLRELDVAGQRYERAIAINPSDSLAWLLKGMLFAFRGEGHEAVQHTERAMRLSPLDPLRYFYESLAASAAAAAGQYDRAIELAQRSLRANRTHTSTLRALAIAQSFSGRLDEARRTVDEIRAIEPTLTVRKYIERSPATSVGLGEKWGEALRLAGLPE